jgi:alkyl hydroperoxide reductase subunit AhpC
MRKFVLGLAALALVSFPVMAGEFNKAITVGQKAPAFSAIPAVWGDKDATLDLDELTKDGTVVLVFLANHCPVVTAVEDRLIDFANDYKDKPVKMVAVCVEDKPQDKLPAIRERVKSKGYNFVYGYDDSQKIGKAYGASNTPQFFVIDKDKTIRYTGAMDDSTTNESKVKKQFLRDAVDAVLKGESVEVKETKPVGCNVNYRD